MANSASGGSQYGVATQTQRGVANGNEIVGFINPSLQSAIQETNSRGSSYYFNGSSAYIQSAISAALAVGTGDLTIIVTASANSVTPSVAKRLFRFASAVDFGLILDTTGVVKILSTSSGGNVTTPIAIPTAKDPFTLAIKRYSSGTKAIVYLNGIANPEITLTADNLSTGVSALLGALDSSTWDGQIFRVLAFNYALSDQEIQKHSAGAKLDYEDVGGSMVDLSASATWSNNLYTTLTSSGNDITVATKASGVGNAYLQFSSSAVSGKKFRVAYSVTMRNGKTIYPQAWLVKSGGTLASIEIITLSSSGFADFTFTGSGIVSLWVQTSGDADFTLTIDSIIQLGSILDLEPENITDTMWVDASPNGLHGTVSGAKANRFTPSYSSRNYIINGAFDFWQRGTNLLDTAQSFVVDRWQVAKSGSSAVIQGQQISDNADLTKSQYRARFQVNTADSSTAAGDLVIIRQKIEGSNAALMYGKQVTLSFWVRAFRTGIFYTAVNGGSTLKSIVFPFTINAANTWEKKSVTFTVEADSTFDRTNGVGVTLAFVLQGGSSYFAPSANAWATGSYLCMADQANFVQSTSDFFDLSDVMLNEGPVAAPFERAGGSIGGELALCQKYFEKSFPLNTAPAINIFTKYYPTTPGRVANIGESFAVRKRAVPTLTTYNATSSGTASWFFSAYPLGGTVVNFAGTAISANEVGFAGHNYPTLVAAGVDFLQCSWTADAEL